MAQSRSSSNHNIIYICEENTTYLTILSSTIGFFYHRLRPEQKLAAESSSVEEDQTDSEASAAVESKWNFLCCRREGSDVVFLVQVSFVCMLVALCVLQLCLRSPIVKKRLPIL